MDSDAGAFCFSCYLPSCEVYFRSEYPFAKYNVPPTTYTYTQDEYTRFLEGSCILLHVEGFLYWLPLDKEWSQDETDYLFNLAREYDSRWYIIHDRYEFPNGVPRTLEVRKYILILRLFIH